MNVINNFRHRIRRRRVEQEIGRERVRVCGQCGAVISEDWFKVCPSCCHSCITMSRDTARRIGARA